MKYHYLAFIDVFQYLAFRTYLLFLQYVACCLLEIESLHQTVFGRVAVKVPETPR